MLRERPHALAPIVQPGYARAANPQCDEVWPLLHQMLIHQNNILELIHNRLPTSEPRLGIPRVFYPVEEPKPVPIKLKGPGGKEKPSGPLLGSPQRFSTCNDQSNNQRTARMSPMTEPQIESTENIEKIENKRHVVSEKPITTVESVDVTTERPKRESRQNDRKRKRDMKRIVEHESPTA